MLNTRALSLLVFAASLSSCSFDSKTGLSNGGNSGRGTIGGGAGGTGASTIGGDGIDIGGTGNSGVGGSCVSGVAGPVITDCGYPVTSNNPLTKVVFNESAVLRAIDPSGGSPLAVVRVFYNDEHALTLGVRQVVVKTPSGTTTTDYPVSALPTSPGSVIDPQTGTNELVGTKSGLDASLRPMWPALFVTDITSDPNRRTGDWQQGGRPQNPNAVFGTWKAAVRTVDTTVTPNVVSITPDADPAKNNWNLAGGDPVPAKLANEGFGAEARWSLPLVAGHAYRVQAMVHDGDQNKAGGDSGEACVIYCAGTGTDGGSVPDGGTPPPPQCPTGLVSCAQTGIDPVSCPAGTVCANGCCLPGIP